MTSVPASNALPTQAVADRRPPSAAEKASRPAAATIASQSTPDVGAKALAAQAAKEQPSTAELKRITEELQRRVNAIAPELRFSVDESSGRTVIQITDPLTKEVIQQIPSEDALRIDKALDRFQQGLLLDRKA